MVDSDAPIYVAKGKAFLDPLSNPERPAPVGCVGALARGDGDDAAKRSGGGERWQTWTTQTPLG